MAYIDYGFYVCTYFGDVVPEFDFLRLAELASDYLDTITFDRLTSGLPENERSKVKVQKAVCAMCEALYQIETAQKNAIAAAGGSSEAVSGGEHTTGIITGKSSGSESITYASPSEMARSASAWSAAYGAAGDPKKTNAMLYAVALPYLSGVCNDEGICLLYAGGVLMHNDTITLFNRYESRLGDMWYATVIPGVHLTMDKAAIQAKYGEASQDNASVSVPFAVKDGKQLVASKEWLPPKQWDSQTNDLLPGTVTFTAGNEFDFFIVGAWDGKSVISDDEYASYSSFYDYMKRSHDYVFAVSSVGGPYNLIPHFEIMGR